MFFERERRGAVAALLLGCTGIAPAWAGDPEPIGDAPASGEASPRGEVGTVSFEDELHQHTDLTLQGTHAERHLDLAIPRAWSITGDLVLRLELSHSAALLAKRSHLTVMVNNQAVGSVTLDETNAAARTVAITIPRGLLTDYNDIALLTVQHYTDECEDPFDPTLWTRVSRASVVEVPYVRERIAEGLEAWPYPMIDPRGFGPVEITPVLTQAPSAAAAEAAGTVAFALGRLASYRTVQVSEAVARVADARGPALLVGLATELPELGALVGKVDLGPSDGLVAVVPNPADPTLPVLLVTGGGPEGIRRAAAALAGQDREPVLSGPWAVVKALAAAPPPRTLLATRTAPREGTFPLSSLGFTSHTVRGFYPDSIHIPIHLEGDSLVRSGGGTLSLHYAYSAQLDERLSALEVRLDGLSLRSIPLDRREGDEDGELSVRLPEDLLTPDAQVDVVFHLFPRDFDACHHVSDEAIWGTILESSTLEVPRDHVALMPDLGRLRFAQWPLSADPTDGKVIAVLPDAPGPSAWAAGLELSAGIGRTSTTDAPAFALELATAASFSEHTDAHFVLLADATANALYRSLAASGSLALAENGADRSLTAGATNQLALATVSAPSDTVEQLLQPSNAERSVLVLHEGQPGGLARLVDLVTDPAKASLLHGNAAVVAVDGSLRVLDTAEKHRWGRLPIATEARLDVRQNWWMLGGGIAFSAVLVAGLVRGLSKSRRGRD
jgi:hypothetical protein